VGKGEGRRREKPRRGCRDEQGEGVLRETQCSKKKKNWGKRGEDPKCKKGEKGNWPKRKKGLRIGAQNFNCQTGLKCWAWKGPRGDQKENEETGWGGNIQKLTHFSRPKTGQTKTKKKTGGQGQEGDRA